MSDNLDISALKASVDIVEFIGRYLPLKKKGEHMVASCPFHDEKSASFTVTGRIQKFKCFGCGKGGDVIDFLVERGSTITEAINILKDPNNVSAVPFGGIKAPSLKKGPPKPTWKQVLPAYKIDGMFRHYKHGNPNMTWEYKTAEGDLFGYVVRFDLPDGKQVLPLIYAERNGVRKWVYKGFNKPRPLYNLNMIIGNPNLPVVVVEGEKTADAAEDITGLSTTWVGGAQGLKYTDWSVLKDRLIWLWPDNDKPGFTAMHNVYDQIKDNGNTIKWIVNPVDADKGWDVADFNRNILELQAYVAKSKYDYPGRSFEYGMLMSDLPKAEFENYHVNNKPAVNTPKEDLPPVKEPPSEDPEGYSIKGQKHFRVLGMRKEGNNMLYCFFAEVTKTVIAMQPSGMTKNNLLQLAPLNWWSNTFEDHRQTFSVEKAVDWLIHISGKYGWFSDKWIRGRGAWIEKNTVVIHAGDKLIVDGVDTPLMEYKSKYIYEMGEALGFSIDGPVNNIESAKLIELLTLLNWERPINAHLLAGWCVIAPICGILNWRSHIWLHGSHGTGKTWLVQKILLALLGETCFVAEGSTTEAGLRQTLGHDALPIVFDEAEGEDKKAQDRMQTVLALARSASSNDKGVIAKGSSGGSSKTYKPKSCFAFSSIAVQVSNQSDRSRVTLLGLKKASGDKASDRWRLFQEKYANLFSDVYCAGIRARTLLLIPVILANIKTFSAAASAEIGEQRAGDQVGALLAGAYSLVSKKKITYKEAVQWVNEKDWDEEKGIGEAPDEERLINYILEQKVRVETNSATVERSIGELALVSFGMITAEGAISPGTANERLKREGIKIKRDYLIVSNSDANLLKLLEGTPWHRNHNKQLQRLKGAEAVSSQRFSSGVPTRAVKIHKDVCFKDYEPDSMYEVPKPELVVPKKPIYPGDSELNFLNKPLPGDDRNDDDLPF